MKKYSKAEAILDQLNFSDAVHISRMSFAVIDRLQTQKPGEQIAAIGCLFILLIQEAGLNPRTVLEKVESMVGFTEDELLFDLQKEHFKALRTYIQEELLK